MIKKIAITVAALIVIGYFGLKYYVARNVSQGVDNVIRSLSSVATIRYASVTTTMGGRLTIDDLTIQPKGLTDVIPIDGIGIAMPSFLDLLSLDEMTPRWLAQEGFPDWVEFFVDGVRIDMQGDYYLALKDIASDANVPSVDEDPIGHCLFDNASVVTMHDTLGYDALEVSLAYTFRQLDRSYALDFRYDANEEMRVEGSMEFEGRARKILDSPNYRPALVGMTLEVNDQGVGDRTYQHCAKLGIDRTTADAAWVMRIWQMFAELGFIPDDRLKAQVDTFVAEQHKNIRVILDPTSPIDLTKVQFYKAEDLPALLGVEVESW